MKLFQNLHTRLAALVAISFNRAERLAILVDSHLRTFPYNYFKIDALVTEKKSFKGFSIFSSGGHLN